MKQLLNILSKGVSILLYPLFIPTYGMVFFCAAFSVHFLPLPAVYWWVSVVGTLVLTCIIPLTAILLLIRRGSVSDLYIARSAQRTTPYIYTVCCFVFWCYFMFSALKVPTYLLLTAVGATIALILVTIINHWWKISAHLSSLGGLIGGVMSFCLCTGIMPSMWLVICMFVLALLLMYARVYLNAHTSLQVVCGFLLGLLMTFLPNLIYCYAQ